MFFILLLLILQDFNFAFLKRLKSSAQVRWSGINNKLKQ